MLHSTHFNLRLFFICLLQFSLTGCRCHFCRVVNIRLGLAGYGCHFCRVVDVWFHLTGCGSATSIGLSMLSSYWLVGGVSVQLGLTWCGCHLCKVIKFWFCLTGNGHHFCRVVINIDYNWLVYFIKLEKSFLSVLLIICIVYMLSFCPILGSPVSSQVKFSNSCLSTRSVHWKDFAPALVGRCFHFLLTGLVSYCYCQLITLNQDPFLTKCKIKKNFFTNRWHLIEIQSA